MVDNADPGLAALFQDRSDHIPLHHGGGLAVFAVLLIVEAARGGWQPDEEKDVAIDWRALGFVAAGLLFNVVLIVPLGFILASTGMFVLIAYGFGDRNVLRSAAIGFAVAVVAYFGFATFLGVTEPTRSTRYSAWLLLMSRGRIGMPSRRASATRGRFGYHARVVFPRPAQESLRVVFSQA